MSSSVARYTKKGHPHAAALSADPGLAVGLPAAADLDVPPMDLLADVAVKLRRTGRDAHVRPDVRRRARSPGACESHGRRHGPKNIFPSLAAGVDAFLLCYADAGNAEGQNDERLTAAEVIQRLFHHERRWPS